MADLAGSIITGIDGNPLATVVKQMGVNMLDIRTDTPLFMSDGSEADKALDQAVGDELSPVAEYAFAVGVPCTAPAVRSTFLGVWLSMCTSGIMSNLVDLLASQRMVSCALKGHDLGL